jgi:hypothetical protein
MVRRLAELLGSPLSSTLDLVDGGAHHFAETIRKIKQK